MQYSDLTTALGALLVIPITNPASPAPSNSTDFNNILPRIIESSEQRIYRELDFLATRTTNATVTLNPLNRQSTLPSNIIVMQGASVITPNGVPPSQGTRVPLEITSKSFIDFSWPQELVGNGVPQYIAQLNDSTVIVGPTADNNYALEVTGIFRPSPMTSVNTSTYLSVTYPDLFLYGCMIFATGYQRDYGAQSDDPKMALSWQAMYDSAKASVMEEEQRRKSQSTNWSPYSPAPLSNPQRR